MNLPAAPSELYPLPTTGEAVDLSKPDEVAAALRTLRAFKQGALADAVRVLEEALMVEMERQGTKTLHFEGMTAKLVEKTETTWDVEALRKGLDRAGCPPGRIDELIVPEVTWKVNASVGRQLASANPKYERALKRHKTVVPGYRYVSVR